MLPRRFLQLALALMVLVAAVEAQRPRERQGGRPKRRKTGASTRQGDDTADVPLSPCSGGESFELITGFVYSSSKEIIDSRVGTLRLSECIEYCRESPRCRALNFETGLCVLFKSAAGEDSDLLAVSQFPVFTLYAQKVCVPAGEPKCPSPWAYESVPDLALDSTFSEDTDPRMAASRSECVQMCLVEEEFSCRSISYNYTTGSCLLSKVNRNMAGRKQLLKMAPGAVYAEVACVPKPQKMCEFTRMPGRILKTVDAVYRDLQTTEECRERCMKSDFTCYSFDFMSAGDQICRLSHHSSATLAHIQEPYLEISNATTYEMQACYQVSVECRGTEMLARISTSTLFDGKVYAKDRPNSCRVDVESSTDFSITLPYNDVRCDVTQKGPATFASNIVIQHHDMIVTSADVGLALHCTYDIKNTTVTNSLLHGLEVKSAIDTTDFYEEAHTVVDSPNVVMRVTNTLGEDIVSAQVGENLALRFEITDVNSPYEIFVREIVAMDGRDNSEIILIDHSGCPTDTTIMQQVIKVDNTTVLHAPFQAFKFPSSEVVQFRALVTPCLPRCEPAQCSVSGFDGLARSENSLGRKKREVMEEADILVAQSVRITDKFEFTAQQRQDEESEVLMAAQGTCSSFTGVVVAGALFLAAQLVMLMAWSYMWHKKRATKQIDPTPPTLYFGTTSSRTSSTSYLTD
ncbi:uncharacterized protein LOC127002106 [Eriocheir sinensis]|uniref:uncharacterized protein LOC127002106 n=1 Tax=Eriocheir sinensis TaxID=95602 RepID=UPI0021C66A4B|nr:uncharacterized protein LOC127002106 [Eriocheir sinensis]